MTTTKTTYNINELLDFRKHLETKQEEIEKSVSEKSLCTLREVERDIMKGTDRETRKIEAKSLQDTASDYDQVTSELVRVRTAITKYNANILGDKLFRREEVRNKIKYLNHIKTMLPLNVEQSKTIIAKTNEGAVQLMVEKTVTPAFDRASIDKMTDNLAKEERKLNTEIQKLNLEQKIEV